MREHDLAMYTIGLILLLVIAGIIAIGLWQDRREQIRFDRAYDQSRANAARLGLLLDESEAAAILREHERRFADFSERTPA